MVNKKGIARIVEASIAVLIVLGVLLFLSGKNAENEKTNFEGEITQYLNEMAQNVSMREKILNENVEAVESFLGERIKNPSLEFEVKICELNKDCLLDSGHDKIDGEIFVSERVISTNVGPNPGEGPKRVKIFLWKKTK